MIQLRIEEILEEQGKSKYWLNKQLGNMCETSIINNKQYYIN